MTCDFDPDGGVNPRAFLAFRIRHRPPKTPLGLLGLVVVAGGSRTAPVTGLYGLHTLVIPEFVPHARSPCRSCGESSWQITVLSREMMCGDLQATMNGEILSPFSSLPYLAQPLNGN